MPTGSEYRFSAPYAPPTAAIAAGLPADARATQPIAGIRARTGGRGGIDRPWPPLLIRRIDDASANCLSSRRNLLMHCRRNAALIQDSGPDPRKMNQ